MDKDPVVKRYFKQIQQQCPKLRPNDRKAEHESSHIVTLGLTTAVEERTSKPRAQ